MEKERIICADCGCEIDYEDYTNTDGDFICEDCMSNYVECVDCGCVEHVDNMVSVKDEWVCKSCIDSDYVKCEECEEYEHRDFAFMITNLYGRDYYVCEHCYDWGGHYCYCEDCGNYFHLEDGQFIDDNFYCEECAENHMSGIMDYHEFDDWCAYYIDNKDESILKGVELEVEGNNHIDMVEELTDIMGSFCVYERDGSLDNGFEIITNPFTMDYMYTNEEKFENALKSLQRNGYTSHNNNRCGLHVHVNRWQLSNNSGLTTDEVIDNILLIMETFKEEIIKFSRRNKNQIRQWCSFLSDKNDVMELSYKGIKDNKHRYGRYVALNLTNDDTIEFRIFRGTLKHESFMACIELVDNICNIAKGNIDGLTWNDLISNGKYVNDYSISRGIESDKVVTIV